MPFLIFWHDELSEEFHMTDDKDVANHTCDFHSTLLKLYALRYGFLTADQYINPFMILPNTVIVY